MHIDIDHDAINNAIKIQLDKTNIKVDIDEEAIEKAVSTGISSSPMGNFLKLLVKNNLVDLNKKVVVKANKNWLSIDGKKLDDATFQKYRQQVEAKNGTLSKEFRFGFEGKILSLKGEDMSLKGAIETDDN